jgi:virginiamycin B lyase
VTDRFPALLAATALFIAHCGDGSDRPAIKEFALAYPRRSIVAAETRGATHEITFDRNGGRVLWVTAHEYDTVVELTLGGRATYHELPVGSVPHGIEFDSVGQLWVSLEGAGQIVRVDSKGQIVQAYDLPSDCTGCAGPVRQDPHGLGIARGGRTIWYTGKTANTVGKITPEGSVASFFVPTRDSLPIYIRSRPDGNMWFTELTGNKIGRITDSGEIHEFPIPTSDSRPIAIIPEPGGAAMWLSEENGNNIARVDMNGQITEFTVPKRQDNVILAGLAFDGERNIWVQQYVREDFPAPAGRDSIIKVDKKVLGVSPSDLSEDDFQFFDVPSSGTVMHRIIQGPDGNMWFTELRTDKVGRVSR